MTILIGFCEIAAAVGLVVPIVADEGEWLTPLVGIGIAVISLMASGFHIRNREWLAGMETVLWASLAGTVAAARWGTFSTGPTISSHDLLGVLLVVLVPAVIITLIVLTRATAPAKVAMSPAGPTPVTKRAG